MKSMFRGTKTDSTSILELFDKDSTILLANPTYLSIAMEQQL